MVLLLRRLEITNLLKQFLLKNFGSKGQCLQHHVVTFKVRWFSTAAATLAACEVQLTSRFLVLQPEQIIPG
jgi:hypothetical protein